MAERAGVDMAEVGEEPIRGTDRNETCTPEGHNEVRADGVNCRVGRKWEISHTSRCCSWLGGECDCLAEDIVRRARGQR